MLALHSWTALVHRLSDDAGRPLGEHRVLGRELADAGLTTVPMELKPCPYPGSRAGASKPINASALHETLRHWRAVVALLGRARDETGVATAMDLWWAGQMAEALPYLILFRHGGRPEQAVVPGALAATYKVMLGTNAGLLGFLLDRPASPRRALPSVDEVYAYVEERGLLVGPEQACAGPEALIRETLSALIHGAPPDERAERLLAALPDAAAFARARASLLVTRLAFGLAACALFSDLATELVAGPPALAAALAEASGGVSTPDQRRFATASRAERRLRLESLLGRAEGGAELSRACERVLGPAPLDCPPEQMSALASVVRSPSARRALGQAVARQQALEDACRTAILGSKRRMRELLPADGRRDHELGLTTARLPSRVPVRLLLEGLARSG